MESTRPDYALASSSRISVFFLFCFFSCRFLVGVEDEQTGELTLHEAGHAYALRQSVGGRQDSVEDHAMEGLEWKQRKDALVNQFGSKKKKAAIRCERACLPGRDSVVVSWPCRRLTVACFGVGFRCVGDGGGVVRWGLRLLFLVGVVLLLRIPYACISP